MYPDGTVEHGVAEDTGGAIKNNRIDVFRYSFDTAMDFGMQEAIVTWN
jgi:3D (Asp-Asp-Asp) domain-containing protein